jgi:hypothetical protein
MNRKELQRLSLRLSYPNATKKQIKTLLDLAIEKSIEIPVPKSTKALDSLLGAIIRHRYTPYDSVLKKGVKKEQARFFIEAYVDNTVKFIKGNK